jgi:hypothetical protein
MPPMNSLRNNAAVLPTFVALHEWYNLHDMLGEHAAFLTHHHLPIFFRGKSIYHNNLCYIADSRNLSVPILICFPGPVADL